MSALIMPPVTHVIVEPARIPKEFVVPAGAIGVDGDVTIAVAVPKIVPLVALTVLVNVPTAPPAVKGAVSPVVPAGMVPPPAVTDHVGVNGEMMLPLPSLPTAVYVIVVLIGSVPGFGVTVIVATGPAVTITVAKAVMPLHVTETVLLNVPGVVPAVKSPVCVIVPPPATTDHVGVTLRTFPLDALATAVNCCVPFMGSVVVVGATVSEVVVRTSVDPLHAERSPAIATAVITRAMRARLPGARKVGLLMTLFIELLLTGCVWMRLLIHGDVVMGRLNDVSSRHFAPVSPDKVKEGVLLLGGRGSQ
jgi:hypothetical protein